MLYTKIERINESTWVKPSSPLKHTLLQGVEVLLQTAAQGNHHYFQWIIEAECVVKGGPQHINYDEKPFSSASLPCVFFIIQFLSSHTAMCEETGPQLQNNLITLRASLCEGVDSHSDQMVHRLPARFRAAYLSRRKLTVNWVQILEHIT